MQRKYMIMITSLMLCTGCTASQPSSSSISIGLAVYDTSDTFISSIVERIENQAEQDANVRVYVSDADRSQSSQNDQVYDFISDGSDVLIVNLVERTGPSSIINAAKDKDIPVIFFNREPLESDLNRWSKIYYVGADAEESGRMQGQIAAAYLSGHTEADTSHDGMIQFYVLEGETGHQDAIIRTESSIETLEQAGISTDKVGYSICDWQREKAEETVTQLIENQTHIELFLCNNDDMAAGAVDAYRKAGIPLEERPLIIGIDGTETGLSLVQSHEMIGTVFNDYEGQADAAYALAKALVQGDSLDSFQLEDRKYIWLSYHKITYENVDEYIS